MFFYLLMRMKGKFGKYIPVARITALPFAVVTHYQQFCYVTIECQATSSWQHRHQAWAGTG